MAVSFNLGSTSFSKQINSATKSFDKAASRISSGSRINSASDDAAGLAIVNALSASAAVRNVASQNASYAQSASDIASSALGQVSDISTRLSELAAQAANGTLSDEQRGTLQAEYTQLTEEISRISATTEFNGVNVLNNSGTSYQIGTDGSSESTIQAGSGSLNTIISSLPTDISSQSAARSALDGLSNTLSQISQQQGAIGATSSRISYADSVNQATRVNEIAAAARIQDADIASEAGNLSGAQVKIKTASFVSSQQLETEKSKFASLLGKIKA
jgi:flagellin